MTTEQETELMNAIVDFRNQNPDATINQMKSFKRGWKAVNIINSKKLFAGRTLSFVEIHDTHVDVVICNDDLPNKYNQL